MDFYLPAGDGDRPILAQAFPDGNISTTSVAVTVINLATDALVATTTGSATQSTIDSTVWLYDTADITGLNLETVSFAQLLIVFTANLSTGGTITRRRTLVVNGARLAITEARLAELDAANLPADVDAILADTAAMEPLVTANLDATVSSRATQAQILSDATPFAGADVAAILADTAAMQPLIDVAVSTRSSHSAGDVDTVLSAAHGVGSWATATGFAVPGDAMDLTTAALTAINTQLEVTSGHGAGLWTSAAAVDLTDVTDLLNDLQFTVAAGSTTTEIRTDATQPDGFFVANSVVVLDRGGTIVGRKLTSYLNTNGAFTVPDLGVTPVVGDTLHVLSVLGLMRRALLNDADEVAGSPGTLALRWDDGATVLIQWELLDFAGNATIAQIGSPARRENSSGT